MFSTFYMMRLAEPIFCCYSFNIKVNLIRYQPEKLKVDVDTLSVFVVCMLVFTILQFLNEL